MSVCSLFRTAKQPRPQQIFNELGRRGQRIVVTSDKFPSLMLGTIEEALRGIETNKEPDGYKVRVCTFANLADLQLYAEVVDVLLALTAVKPIIDGKTAAGISPI